jgi:hypothetical protein
MPDEKMDEKQDEKSQEKTWEEKWRRDPLNSIVWAAILIWFGVVLLIGNLGLFNTLNQFLRGGFVQINLEAWSIGFLGAGVILVLEVLARLMIAEYRQPVTGTLVLAAIFIGIGLGNIIGGAVTWALILIALGFGIILRGVARRA